jgi:mannose-6-phosphate isomerase class I
MFLIQAGTLHSVGAGFLILEVQQPSDVTFRLYDWGRVDENGETRELHSEQAVAAIHYDRFDLPRPRRTDVAGPTFKLKTLSMGAIIPADQLRVFVGHKSDETKLLAEGQEFILKYGDILVGEPSDGPISVAFGNCVLLSEPSK